MGIRTRGGSTPDGILEGKGLWRARLLLFESLPSTNQWAMGNLDSCRHGDVVCAARQTAGRGRFSRSWLVPGDRGLALSVVLRETGGEQAVAGVGQIAALAVRECLGSFSVEAMLKWPNDVLVQGRKIAGILADAATGSVVLGIGLNVNVTEEDFRKAGLDDSATSMLIERGRSFEMETVRARALSGLETIIDSVRDKGFDVVLDAWRRHDWLAGSSIEVSGPAGSVRGQYAGMDAMGRLLLTDSSGVEHALWSGDVEKIVETKERT